MYTANEVMNACTDAVTSSIQKATIKNIKPTVQNNRFINTTNKKKPVDDKTHKKIY